MSDLICKNTMARCQTMGMCAPYGGCRETEPVSSVWLEQLRAEFRQAVRDRDRITAENESLRREADQLHHECARFRKNSDRYLWLRDIHIGDDPFSINLNRGSAPGLNSAVDSAMREDL